LHIILPVDKNIINSSIPAVMLGLSDVRTEIAKYLETNADENITEMK
jgi:hypothetical protein